MLAKQAEREQNQIVEVHRVAGVEGGLVAFGDVFGQGADVGIAEDPGAFAAVLELAQHGQHGGGVGFLALAGEVREDFFDGAELFRFVVDDEVAFVAEFLDVLAEDADAERVKGANGGAVGLLIGGGFWRFEVGRSLRTRSCISRAALLVKVTPRMWPGATPRRRRKAMRWVMTRVLPVPAPARMSTGPLMDSTAWRWGGLSVLRSNIGRGV